MQLQGRIMSETRYYWLKLMKDFFSNPKIKKLRKLAGGDTFTVIYLKLQLLSIDNEGVLIFQGIENTFEEEMALTIDEDIDNVSVTLNYLISQGLMEKIGENEYLLTETQYLIGSESSVTQRVRKHREMKKALQSNTNVTIGNTEKEKEEEIDKELDKEKKENKKKKETLSSVINEYTDNEELRECLKEFVEMRKAGQRGMFTVSALKRNLTKLDTLAVNDGAKIDIVNQTIEYTYKGFYPLKETKKNNQKGGMVF